jgi:uncharacterized protein YjiS (DUF1127 family)
MNHPKNIHFQNEPRSGIRIKSDDETLRTHHQMERSTMSTRTSQTCTVTAPNARRLPALTSPLAWLLACLALRRQRLHLAELDERQLRDIGVTPDQMRAEANRPIWDVPAHWLR